MTIGEVEQWHHFVYNGITYDLSHLNASKVVYTNPKTERQYEFIVTYSFHCFAKDDNALSAAERSALLYIAPRDSRPFHFERYEDSKQLPEIIRKLHQAYIFDAGYDGCATVQILNEAGILVHYKIIFKAFREKKKFRLHISSAHRLTVVGKTKRINFFTIAESLVKNKPLPRNP